ncbi:MAG: hypothetical protein ACTSSI_15615 [Candidatus Helarchaeota archaeon]
MAEDEYPEFPPNYRQAECCATCKFSQDQVEESDLDLEIVECKLFRDFCKDDRTLVLYSEVNVCDRYERCENFVGKVDVEYLEIVQHELEELENESDDLDELLLEKYVRSYRVAGIRSPCKARVVVGSVRTSY